jgi:hypothetical protein
MTKDVDTLASTLAIGCLIGMAVAVPVTRRRPCGNCADLVEQE